LLLLVRKGEGATSVTTMREANALHFLARREQLILCEDGVLRRWILTCGLRRGASLTVEGSV
jgi:hypothetical protein